MVVFIDFFLDLLKNNLIMDFINVDNVMGNS